MMDGGTDQRQRLETISSPLNALSQEAGSKSLHFNIPQPYFHY